VGAGNRPGVVVPAEGRGHAVTTVMLCPSRGRPANANAVCVAWAETDAAARLIVVADADDPNAAEYRKLPCEVRINEGPQRLGPILNAEAVRVCADPDVDVIGFLGDDHRPRTWGWDTLLRESLGQAPGVAYGNDLLQEQNLPTAVVMTADLVRGLGYMVPPGLAHLYLDDFWKRLGQDVGHLVYRSDVVIEHMHPVAGKAGWDAGYERVNAPELYASDLTAYELFLRNRWPADLARLKEQLR
jgi:hypothetical protein